MRSQQTKPGMRTINSQATSGMWLAPRFSVDQCRGFRWIVRCCFRFAKKFIEEAAAGTFPFRQIDIDEHHPRGVEHETAVRVSRDHCNDFAGIIFYFTQHGLAERPIWIRVTVTRYVARTEAVGELLRGLIRQRFRLSETEL